MLKKIVILLLMAGLILSGMMSAQASVLSEDEMYMSLQEELHRCLDGGYGAMTLSDLTKQFESLGHYMKSAQFSYYAAILRDADAGDYSRLLLYTRLLRTDAEFCAMLPEEGFPTVEEVEAYALGRQAEELGDWSAAIGYYEQSVTVLDGITRLMSLLTAGPTATPTPEPTPVPTPTPAPTPTPTATPKPTPTVVPTPTPVPVLVDQNVKSGDYTIDTYSNRTCVIKKYTGNRTSLIIPETIDGYLVTGIGKTIVASDYFDGVPYYSRNTAHNVFFNCDALTNIVIPDSVTFIGDSAFVGCESLKSINVPDSVMSIGMNPFAGCGKLTQINVSGTHPFLENRNGVIFDKLEKKLICYPAGLAAGSYTVPAGTKTIGGAAFGGASFLRVTIPDGVTSIGDWAFSGCSFLIDITWPANKISIGDYAFANCSAFTSVTLPECITSIGNYAFWLCRSLTDITLPGSVTSVGINPFKECSKLTQIKVSAPSQTLESRGGVLLDKREKKLICYPGGLHKESYTVPDGTRIIGKEAFSDNYLINHIYLPAGLISIEDYAFVNCVRLIGMTIPNSVTSIGDGIVYNCYRLYAIKFPDKLTSIGNEVCYKCERLTKVTLPSRLTSIGNNAFYNCRALTDITLPSSVTSIGENAFYCCEALAKFTVPSSVTSIADEAFTGCGKITFRVRKDSYAYQYAQKNKIRYVTY